MLPTSFTATTSDAPRLGQTAVSHLPISRVVSLTISAYAISHVWDVPYDSKGGPASDPGFGLLSGQSRSDLGPSMIS